MPQRIRFASLIGIVALAGCDGPQSTLNTAGVDAEEIASLFWVMAAGAAVVWVTVMGVAAYCMRTTEPTDAHRTGMFLIVGGGVVLPTVVLGALLPFGLSPLPRLMAPAPAGSLRITVVGEQWWWRVRYESPAGASIDLANEIRLPVGERIDVSLTSDNVIHSFWIPALAGKVDMIPGRVTRLSLEPTRTGKFRGVCAEYCGTSHALMAFSVAVMEKSAFEAWLAAQAMPAVRAPEPQAVRGRGLFVANGCAACHTIRGTTAAGVVGPDLTHVASRLSLAAGTLANTPDNLIEWVARPDRVKPDAHMPPFEMLPAEDLRAMAVYLGGLR